MAESSVLDKRIHTAITGLEALLTNDNMEVSYKLQMRVARLMSHFGRNPLDTRKLIKDAYSIRSQYAHGVVLKEKSLKLMIARHGSIDSIYNEVLYCLRIAILALVNIQLTKDNFINILDDSLIEGKVNKKLRELTRTTVKYI